jgi:Ca-activated chloride channel family protein
MTSCDAIRQRLAEDGAEAAELHADIRHHLEACASCTNFLAQLQTVDSALEALPCHDASDALVADTLRAVRQAADKDPAPARPSTTRRYLAGGLAASVVVVASLGLMMNYLDLSSQRMQIADAELDEPRDGLGRVKDQIALGPVAEKAPAPSQRGSELPRSQTGAPSGTLDEASRVARGLRESFGDDSQVTFETARLEQKKHEAGELRSREFGQTGAIEQSFSNEGWERDSDQGSARELDIIAQLTEQPRHGDRDGRRAQDRLGGELAKQGRVDFYRQDTPETPVPEAKTKPDGQYRYGLEAESEPPQDFAERSNEESLGQGAGAPVEQEGLSATGQIADNLRGEVPAPIEGADMEAAESRPASIDKKNRSAKLQDTRRLGADPDTAAKAGASTPAVESATAPLGGALVSDENRRQHLAPQVDQNRARLLAANFLQRAQALDNLSFREPRGYWSNSYIPGDPAMRLLQARLRAWDRRALGHDLRLEQAVRQVVQPFDAPRDAAMAVYLHADAPAIDGPTRLRVQVGLKGAERQGGHRPAMNIGLVVDLRRTTDANTGARIRALIAALNRVRQPEDRFSLTVAGPDGGLLVPPEQFRHGPLRVAMDRLFGGSRDTGLAPVSLQQALARATESVRQGDDPNAVLGSSLVLLVTGSSLADELAALERIAHDNAVGGVPLSVVSLAARDDSEHIDRLVAAGQGNRRVLDSAQAADALVDRELHSASRAVARALRLRIRLAPGVKLVDVLGSRRLGEPQAQRVREAEQSIDQRLARNLGIQADRGEDEEGIQIVIPSFYAGDTHVVLLDVIAENPGAVADVTLRYKDVVYLRNGVARAGLTLGGSRRVSDPLERNVLKNLVAWEFARQTRRVGRSLAAGDPQQARSQLAALRELIQGLRLEVTGWSGDPDLAADETLLGEYLTLLDSPAIGDPAQRRFVADSLRFAAFRKLQSAAR